jgi:hypothetical protein
MALNSSGKRVLIGITTSPYSKWEKKIRELDKYKIKEIAFFPTFLTIKQRKKSYALLEKTKLQRIPHVHLRHNMEIWEVKYLIKKYKTELFNTHPEKRGFNLLKKFEKYKNLIYIENLYAPKNNIQFSEESFKKYHIAGICLDLAHLERERLVSKNEYLRKIRLIKKYKIGCNHLSAIARKKRIEMIDGDLKYDQHAFRDLSEFDYIKEYPLSYFGNYISLELENPLDELFKAKKCIEKIIKSKKNE